MTESLRERCIEAIWPYCARASDAEKVIDAVLDVLEESADEWAKTAFPYAHYEPPARMLLAVLRGNGE